MTNATRAGINLGQSLARSPTVSRSMSGGLRDARYLRDSTIADAVTAPAYTFRGMIADGLQYGSKKAEQRS